MVDGTNAPEITVTISKVRGEPTFLNVYLKTGEYVGAKRLGQKATMKLVRELVGALSIDVTDGRS